MSATAPAPRPETPSSLSGPTSAPGATGRPGRSRRARQPVRSTAPQHTRRAQARLGLILVAPLLAVYGIFLLFPMVNSVYFVFVDFNGINANPPWVGFANFIEVAQDSKAWSAFRNNGIWIVIGTIGPLVVGLGLALLVWAVPKGTVVYRIAFFLPYVLPQVALGIVWSWIYDPTRGWLNRVLEFVGLEQFTAGWLGNPDTALYAVLATAIWATSGFVFVILLAALRNVDADLLDAARLDGANPTQRLQHIILPQIMPVFLMVTTLTLIGGFSVFDWVFVMTGGGPAGASEVLGTYAYSSAFQLNRISYGTTLALIITLLAVPFALALNRLQRRLSQQGTGA